MNSFHNLLSASHVNRTEQICGPCTTDGVNVVHVMLQIFKTPKMKARLDELRKHVQAAKGEVKRLNDRVMNYNMVDLCKKCTPTS